MSENIIDFRELCNDPTIKSTIDETVISDIFLPPANGLSVSLTFDDGPYESYTPAILDLLKEYGAKATFFVYGEFVSKFPEMAQRIVAEGHEIGNHTFTHPDLTTLTLDELMIEIQKTEHAIKEITQSTSVLFRPPYGCFPEAAVPYVEHLGYRFVLWSRDMYLKDWELPGADVLANRILTNVRSGSIILLHDGGGNREQTVEAVKKILPLLTQQGYQFVTVSKLITEYNKVIQNKVELEVP
ncbi:polysaccharide deacetylase family protein [Paenibacillus sp. GbtcB18]|uniref:polysaccharide deacetylase family protein n=1 Tax=Paenibacillus sp. GbtcB18 TaxID=2824763 RepID=UPI001C2F35BE|nr:polysaccharide deacetylase family protein [Paenibacillus sp. GbtcB18]